MPGVDHSQHQGHQQPTPQTPAQQDHSQHQMRGGAQPTPSPQTQGAPAGGHQGHGGHSMQGASAEQLHATAMTTNEDALADIARVVNFGDGASVRLEELEVMATENNPTLKQAELAIAAAEGRRRQAGLFPNPIVGYMGEEFSVRNFSESSEHMFFVEQRIPLGGKLPKSRRVFAQEVVQAQARSEAQRARVLNSVRVLYYETLGAQQLVEIHGNLVRLAREAVSVSAELYNVGQADRPDQLEIEIEAQRMETELLQARNDWEQAWRALAAIVGKPEMQPARLAGNLEEGGATLDQDAVLATLLRDSPEIKAAQAGVERARAAFSRARAERVPDLFLRGGFGYNNERLEEVAGNRRVGPEGFIEAGVTLPIFNRNQGGIAAAEAELGIAEREVQRLQLALRTRLASSFRDYRNSLLKLERYRTRIIPRAQNAYTMYLANFRQMAAAYPQVLIAQRTFFQTQVEYAQALIGLRRNLVGLRGFLLTGGLNAAGTSSETDATEAEEFRISAENPANDPDN